MLYTLGIFVGGTNRMLVVDTSRLKEKLSVYDEG